MGLLTELAFFDGMAGVFVDYQEREGWKEVNGVVLDGYALSSLASTGFRGEDS